MSEIPIIELDSIDSTNNYAMQLIDADKAQHGLTIVAQSQTQGKGQRGRTWMDEPGQSLLMSIVIAPALEIKEQFVFNSSVATAIANVLQKNYPTHPILIKWPNDIIIGDKKAGGILIENVLRGSRWTYSVIGLGLNIKQTNFPPQLPYATSLKIATGEDTDITALRDGLRESIVGTTTGPMHAASRMKAYNNYLYKRGQNQGFSDAKGKWNARIIQAHSDGTIEVQLPDGNTTRFHHGEALWDWGHQEDSK